MCDIDDDDDGVLDTKDNCPYASNTAHADTDKDGLGDVCVADDDGDGVADALDNCALVANPGQTDSDQDGKGDACDADADGDGVLDVSDTCPGVPNPSQVDTDKDGLGDACDPDDDGDGVADGSDTCPLVKDPAQIDTDKDGAGDACDIDDDGDGVLDTSDNCPLAANTSQTDTDQDGLGDPCDDDDDGDGVADGVDTCPLVKDPAQTDTDKDGAGDACDIDDDGDGTVDASDCAPLDGARHPGATEVCNGLDDDCDTDTDEGLGSTSCGLGVCAHTAQSCQGGKPATCDPLQGATTEACGNGLDDDCDGFADEGCIFSSCKAILAADKTAKSGTFTIDPDGAGGGAPFDVECDMGADGGGWTLVGVVSNSDGVRSWNSVGVLQDGTTFGALSALTVDFKSKSWLAVAGNDLLVRTEEYGMGFRTLLGNRSLGQYIKEGWPASCNATWAHGKPEYVEGLTAAQASLFGVALRGWDNNASCFPDMNENSAISLMAADCCWVNGLGNNTCCQAQWISHDLSLLKKSQLATAACVAGQWPCNPQGVYLPAAGECYDSSCKSLWARVYVR